MSTPETITINDTILQLDELTRGYAEVLQQAKTQLENFELSESDWDKLAAQLQNQINYVQLANTMTNRLSSLLNKRASGEPPTYDEYLVEHLYGQISEQAYRRIKMQVVDLIREEVRRQTQDLRETIVADARLTAESHINSLDRKDVRAIKERDHALQSLLHDVFKSTFQINALEAARQLNEELEQNKLDRQSGVV